MMTNFIETREHKGYQIKIHHDDMTDETPNDWTDVELVYNHNQFYVGRNKFSVHEIIEYFNALGYIEEFKDKLKHTIQAVDERLEDRFEDLVNGIAEYTENDLEELNDHYQRYIDLYNTYGDYHIFPVYAYIHSGVALSLGNSTYPFNDRWDVSCSGFMLVPTNIAAEESDAEEVAKGLIREWNMVLRGEVYSYIIDDPFGQDVDALAGLFGEDHLMENAIDVIETDIQTKRDEHYSRVKKQIRNRVPYQYRKSVPL